MTALTLLAAGCSNGPSAEVLMAKAQEAQVKGNYKTAIIYLKNVLQKNEENAEARYLLGLSYNEAGEPRSAEKEFRAAIDLHKDEVIVKPHLVKALLLQGDYERVLKETQQEEDGIASAPELLSARGIAQLSLGSIDAAKISFNEALAKSPGFPNALLGQARIAAAVHDIATASGLVDQALKKLPRDLDGLLVKGDLLRLANDNEAALVVYQKVTAYYPDNITARLNIAAIYLTLSQYDKVAQQVDAVLKMAPQSPTAFYLQGLMEFKKQNYVKARAAVEEALRALSTHLPSRLLGGSIEYVLGNYPEAEQHLRYVLSATPGNIYARKLLTVILLRNRQTPRAISVLLPALNEAPEDPALLALAGEAFMQNNEFDKAAVYYAKAANNEPKNVPLRTALGVSLLAAGESDRAVLELESAIGLDRKSSEANILQVMTRISQGDFENAGRALQSLEKQQPDNPVTYNFKAAIFIGQKKYGEARSALEQALRLSPSFFPAIINLAQLDLRDGKPKVARQRFDALLQKEPGNLQALLALASMGDGLGANPGDILSWLIRARNGNPGSIQPILMLSKYYLAAGDARKSMGLAKEAQAMSPDNADVLDMLGRAQMAVGENNSAVTTYSRLVSLQPQSPMALVNLANAQIGSQNPPGASFSLQKALELEPHLVEAQVSLAMIEARAGRISEAMRIVSQVRGQQSSLSAGIVLEGDVRMVEKKYSQAVTLYEKAFALAGTADVVVKMHEALLKDAKFDEAEATLVSWISNHPEDISMRVYLANESLKIKNYTIAIEQYEWVIKRQPNNVLSLNNLAWAYQLNKDPRALGVGERAYDLSTHDPLIMDTYGWMLVNHGKVEKGLDLLQRASALAPDQPEIRYHYAVALVKSGKDENARIELEQTQKDKKQLPEATDLLKRLNNE